MQIIKTVLWSAIGGALVWWVVLSAVLGWMPAGSAEQQAVKRAKTAILDVLTPICVERFQQDAESEVKLKALKEKPTWNQADYIVQQGWATMPENDISENSIAKACASRILTVSSS
ncbi:hypothetical protein [Candidatus Entotheonella palauensis]|nr:hypothetical protein [Candidatus Entotheonella palauensis]